MNYHARHARASAVDKTVVDTLERVLKKRLDRVRKGACLAAWPTNCLRHSFGSYRIADCSDVARVSMEMGNTPQVIFNHYREVVTPAEAARFWSIMPSTAKEKIVAFTAK